ncbi:M48 family metalloprotease [Jannaschia sp. S6380]|uniref:M48 family metalloprotease n=1 Tax=Jannaschia sp. S6380 TaxID=2926408 RepID=UPI001FF246D1|nr:M48 family metalloprotease [Jannaschia sp. S6380]MCK0167538.1 M48 family metalloprotease [Jannaschia sp. S6380]
MLRDMRNDDELAFVLGHEYGDLDGQHIQKPERQARAGAPLLGVVVAAATQRAQNSGQIVGDSMEIGSVIGQRALSQTYKLESDTPGTLITHRAGYDPVRGAAYLARPDKTGSGQGQLSFWDAHPPDATRLATIMATVRQIESRGGIGRKATR